MEEKLYLDLVEAENDGQSWITEIAVNTKCDKISNEHGGSVTTAWRGLTLVAVVVYSARQLKSPRINQTYHRRRKNIMGTATYKNKHTDGSVYDAEYVFSSIDELDSLINFDDFLSPTEIVNYICSTFTPDDIKDITSIAVDDLIKLHMTTGRDIRNIFGLWLSGNPYVGSSHPDDVSHEILVSVWERYNNKPVKDDSQIMNF